MAHKEPLNSIERSLLLRRLARNNEILKKLEASLKGVQLGTIRFADAAITDAKINNLSADKITSGSLQVDVGVGSSVDGEIILDGVSNQIKMFDSNDCRLLIGDSDNGFTIRISLDGIEADETSPDARDYALLADADNILIKEKSRGSVSVNNNSSATINHGLGYRPHFMGYTEVDTGTYKLTNGFDPFGPWRGYVDSTNLYFFNRSGATRTAKYFIFYDNMD